MRGRVDDLADQHLARTAARACVCETADILDSVRGIMFYRVLDLCFRDSKARADQCTLAAKLFDLRASVFGECISDRVNDRRNAVFAVGWPLAEYKLYLAIEFVRL